LQDGAALRQQGLILEEQLYGGELLRLASEPIGIIGESEQRLSNREQLSAVLRAAIRGLSLCGALHGPAAKLRSVQCVRHRVPQHEESVRLISNESERAVV
jgi:hypothetical protein